MKMDSYDYYMLGQEYLDRKAYQNAIKYFLMSLKIEEHYKTYEKLYECYNCINCKELANHFIKLAYETHPKRDKVALIYVKVLKEEKEFRKCYGYFSTDFIETKYGNYYLINMIGSNIYMDILCENFEWKNW